MTAATLVEGPALAEFAGLGGPRLGAASLGIELPHQERRGAEGQQPLEPGD